MLQKLVEQSCFFTLANGGERKARQREKGREGGRESGEIHVINTSRAGLVDYTCSYPVHVELSCFEYLAGVEIYM